MVQMSKMRLPVKALICCIIVFAWLPQNLYFYRLSRRLATDTHFGRLLNKSPTKLLTIIENAKADY